MTADIFNDCRLELLDVFEEVAGVATLLREGSEVLQASPAPLSKREGQARGCAEESVDAANAAITKLRAITLKLEGCAR